MQSQTQNQCLAYLLLVATFALSAASAESQERRPLPNNEVPIINGACPRPIALTLTANPPSLVATDLTPAQLAAQVGFNYSGPDKHVGYTFNWKREEGCCQITKALLTVKVRANRGGLTSTSPDAGNDGIAIMHGGVSLQSQAVYTQFPVIAGQTYTVQVNLNSAALNNISALRQLTFNLQDDSGVQSASLQLWGCCLATNANSPPGPTAYTTKGACEDGEKQPCSLQYGAWHRTN